jgi:hypothetical protein
MRGILRRTSVWPSEGIGICDQSDMTCSLEVLGRRPIAAQAIAATLTYLVLVEIAKRYLIGGARQDRKPLPSS